MLSESPYSTKQAQSVPIIGLLGGIASGKSYVGAELARLGCVLVDADRLGHDVLRIPAIRRALRDAFGPELFDENDQVDRRKLAAQVFGEDLPSLDRRKRLENIVHPVIHREMHEQIATLSKSSPPPRAIVIDAPLLIEAGWASTCDYMLFIDTPDEVRRQRALARGWTIEQWQAREAAQILLDLKRQAATHFIPGDATNDWLRRRLEVLLDEIDASREE